ncbi:hypothetical protein MBLNU457_6734t1 [Dothideomycetes sp. NU457]
MGPTNIGSQGVVETQFSVGREASSESIKAASAIAAIIPVVTEMPYVSSSIPGALKQGPPTSVQDLGTKLSAAATIPNYTGSPLVMTLPNIAISADAQADTTGLYIGSILLGRSSTITTSDMTFLYAPTGSAILIENGQTTIVYMPSGQPHLIQPALPSSAAHSEATTRGALLDTSGDGIASTATSDEAPLATSSIVRHSSSGDSTAQILALTQASTTYYLTHSHNSLVVIGSQTLSVGGPVATIGAELVSIASTAIIVNGRSTIPFVRSLATTTASQVPSIVRAPTAGLANSSGLESTHTDGASPTAAKSSHIASSGGVRRFHKAPHGAAVALCFFALVFQCR